VAAIGASSDGVERHPPKAHRETYNIDDWDGLCQVCHKRPGTEEVHGVPGGLSHECRQCIVEAQLKHAREQAARIQELEKELEQLTTKGPS